MSTEPGLPTVLLIAPKAPPYGGVALQAGRLHDLLRAEGVSVILQPSNPPFPLPLRFLEHIRGLRPFFRSIIFCAGLRQSLANTQVAHLMACSWAYFFFIVWPAAVLCWIHSIPLVVNYRGGDARRFFRWFGWAAVPVFKAASIVTAPSDFLARLIKKRFQVPVAIVPNIVETSMFRYRERTSFAPRMIVTRHLEKAYDIESVLKAFRSVQQRHPDASLLIAGTGSEEQHLRHMAALWGLRRVQFLGHVPQKDLPALYDQCDILLNASRIDNFPGALLEGSAAGLAIVSTWAGGIPFIYQNGKNAILVEPGDWEGLAAGVETVIRDSHLAGEMTRQAVLVAKSCEWNHVRKELFRSYGFAARGAGRHNYAPVSETERV